MTDHVWKVIRVHADTQRWKCMRCGVEMSCHVSRPNPDKDFEQMEDLRQLENVLIDHPYHRDCDMQLIRGIMTS